MLPHLRRAVEGGSRRGLPARGHWVSTNRPRRGVKATIDDVALDARATVDREEFFGFQHGDGRLQLIERLAASYRAGELPDYMLEFVDSLRTRTTRATS